MNTRTLTIEKKPKPQVALLGDRLWRSEHFVLLLTVVYFLVLLPFIPRLASPYNLGNVLSNVWPLLIIAVGQTVVLIVGGIDLSQTSVMALASVIGAVVMTSAVDPVLFEKSPLWSILLDEGGGPLAGSALAMPVALLVMLGVGAVIGLLNGLATTRLKMPPFMVTLVSMMFFSALAIFLTRSENVTRLPAAYLGLSRDIMPFLPPALFIAVFVALAAHLMLSRTVPGQWFFAVGRNPRAALVSGVPVGRIVVAAYVLSGMCAALGGALYSARLEAGRPTLGQNLLLDIVGATVIGGTSLFGGKGKILWTFYGVLFFAFLANTLNLLGLSFYTVDLVKGSVILLAATADVLRSRKARRNPT